MHQSLEVASDVLSFFLESICLAVLQQDDGELLQYHTLHRWRPALDLLFPR